MLENRAGRDLFRQYYFIVRKQISRYKINAETKWTWIPKHFNHRYKRYMQFYKLHDFTVLWVSLGCPGRKLNKPVQRP